MVGAFPRQPQTVKSAGRLKTGLNRKRVAWAEYLELKGLLAGVLGGPELVSVLELAGAVHLDWAMSSSEAESGEPGIKHGIFAD